MIRALSILLCFGLCGFALADDCAGLFDEAAAAITKDGPYAESVVLRNREDIEPGFGTRIRTFVFLVEFAPAYAGEET